MKTLKKIVGVGLVITLRIVELPFTIMSIVGQLVEYHLYLPAVRTLIKWSGCELGIEGFNHATMINSEAGILLSDFFDDLEIEQED